MINIKKIFSFFKIHHSIKNISIFLPIFASHQILNINYTQLIFFFFNITFLSLLVYCINNIYDYEYDLKNKNIIYKIDTTKKNLYYTLSVLIFFVQIVLLIYIEQKIWLICLFYFILSILYNVYLKKIKYIDIVVVCIFHIVRIFYGSIAFNIDLTNYFLVFFICLFLMIVVNKRILEIELKYLNRPYNLRDLKVLYPLQLACAIISVIIFTMYIINPVSSVLFQNSYMLIINLIIFCFILANFIIYQRKYKIDVVIFFYKNKFNYLLCFLFLTVYFNNSLFF